MVTGFILMNGGYTMNKERVSVAVVGYGYWGPNLLRNFAQLSETCDLVLCCDQNPERLAKAKRLYPDLQTSTSFQEVLDRKDIDAVAIATPARTHAKLVREALQHDKHVMVEKPLAMTTAESVELTELAEQRNRTLMVGHTFLYNPALLKVKELCTPDYLGDLFYLYSHRVNLGIVQSDINALWSIAPHDVSIALYLVGDLPVQVTAQGASYLSAGIEDVVFLTMTFPNGVVGHIHVSWIDPSKTRKLTVVGSKKMITYDDLADEGKVKVYDKAVSKVKGQDNPSYGEFHYRLHSGDILAPRVQMSEPLANECGHFIDCVLNGCAPVTDGHNGVEVVSVLEAAQRSLENNGAQELVHAHTFTKEPVRL